MPASPPHDHPQVSDPTLDLATASGPLAEDQQSHRWSFATRILFRFAFCYIATWCLCVGNATIWDTIPIVGGRIQEVFARIFLLPAQYLAQHLFHVPSPGNIIHPTGSGDTAINWIANLILAALALTATVVWSALDRRRPHYQTLAAWLRFLVRLTLGFGMVTYGLAKVFPLQMAPPSISSLSEPLGMHSPMAVLWDFIGFNPWYESVCGAAELIGGLLLLLRRTALLGALFTAFVVANVVLYNFFFDVPVKLYSAHLLLLALFVVFPDAKALARFFWLHQPAAPTGVWVPPASRPWFRRATLAVEIAFAVFALGGTLFNVISGWMDRRENASPPCELCSDWRLDKAAYPDGTPAPPPSAQGHPAVELVIDTPTRALLRDALGNPTYLQTKTDAAAHTLEIHPPGEAGTIYRFALDDPSHLTLTPTPAPASHPAKLTLTRLTPPHGYPLLHRGFHWISEYPYER